MANIKKRNLMMAVILFGAFMALLAETLFNNASTKPQFNGYQPDTYWLLV